MQKLTGQQSLFVDYYLETLDPQASALKAGYKPAFVKFRLDELFNNPKIVEEMYFRLDYYAAVMKVTRAYLIRQLIYLAQSALEHEEILDKAGAPTGRSKIKEPAIALRAIETLAKYVYMGADPKPQETEHQVVCIENLDDKKI